MDQVEVPESQVVPIDDLDVATGVRVLGLRIAFVNVFGVIHPDGTWTLIDAGIPFSASYILRWADRHFHRAPNAIVLTHGHFDHVSAAGELAEHWSVPVYAHPLEFPYLTGEKEYPKPNAGAGGGAMPLMAPMFPRGPVDLRRWLKEIPSGDGEPFEVMPGWEVLLTPGHTPGHVSFFRRSDRTLLVGDAFCTTKPEAFFEAAVAQHAELHGPPAYFTWDWAKARASVETLAGLDPKVVIPGHGKPVAGAEVAAALHKLAQNFDRIAVPDNRKSDAA
ncbi:MAG TPA: MBL fold metallo-hydrolase [Acidisarcina sp.]